ncbi:hypothetical protein [Aeromicrobium sp. IC_218]|uniref:hypothetical protein n=1 Tax=Aeromicrobium sp. IC_218 TaxID=2545468 RepID=UPI00103C4989|nr:hypothetical protein [Aeromicrobium sp. IC_218]TCI98737.1 hypothetical protein E0W78_10250 [Aeromicrobium sp. IC_218]
MGDRETIPVLQGVAGPERARRARAWRRVGVVLLGLVVLVACLGWLGPRDTSGSADGPGPALELQHPLVTRAGQDAAVVITVDSPAPGASVVLELEPAMLERLGLELMSPEPSAQTGDADRVRLTFDAPPSGPLTVSLSGRTPTEARAGRFSYSVRAPGPDGVTEVGGRTWVLP